MKLTRTGFAVIYQWRVKAGMGAEFRAAWEDLTAWMEQRYGALGARLHRTDNGNFVAYTQWPDHRAWEKSCTLQEEGAEQQQSAAEPDEGDAISQRLLATVEEAWSPMFLSTISDRLVPEQTQLDLPRDVKH